MDHVFNPSHPSPVARYITHIGDGTRHEVRIARHAADVETRGTKHGAELDEVVAWEAVCAGVGSDPASGSNIFVSLPDDALQQFSTIAGSGVIERLRVRSLADDPARSVIEISDGAVSAAVILTTSTLHAATASPRRVLLTSPGPSLGGNDGFGLLAEALRAAARNMSHSSAADGVGSETDSPDAAFGDVCVAFALPL
jgi:hypothetical protein